VAIASPQFERHRFSVEDYHRMAEAGILGEDDRVELIEGEVIAMSPIGSRHASCVDRHIALLNRRIGDRAILRVQGPIRLDDCSEPEPDLVLLRTREDFYSPGHPRPDDVHLLIEVMDTTAAFDRGIKVALYARAGISEVWLVDLNQERVEVHRRPEAGAYSELQSRGRGDSVSAEAFPDVVLPVDAILGEANR